MNQSVALGVLKSGENVFLTGSAGAGKTYVLNKYISYLKNRKVAVAVTASTGIAATHMNGMTIHAWAGIGIKNQLSAKDYKFMEGKKYLKDKFEEVQVLIIDEISMLHKNQLSMVDEVLRHFKKKDVAFGGIQVVFAGDFFQLPPVGNNHEAPKDKFAFMSKAWVDANIKVCYISEQHRQSENTLTDVLNEIRSGFVSPGSVNILQGATQNALNEDAPKLFTHNADVDKINNEKLLHLPGEIKNFNATTKGNEKLVESLSKSVLAPATISLKKDAKIMFVRNNPENGVVNGTLGEILSFTDDDSPVVKLVNGRTLIVEPETWSVNDDKGKALAEYTQLPLRLAWAITIHKSQGMTLDSAQIDLSKTFERGQGYVALSRLKDTNGLQLLGFNQTALEVDSLAAKADSRFKQLTKEIENAFDESSMEKQAMQFLRNIGALTDEKEIEKYARKKADRKNTKLATHEKTAQLIANGLSIGEIAEKRGLGDSTILNHVVKISETMPHIDLESCKPKKAVLEQVHGAFNQLQEKAKKGKSSGPSLKNMYAELDGKLDYNTIKLALVFK